MKLKKNIRLSIGRSEAEEVVYRYMQANGYYPLDEQRTHYTANSRSEGFYDPRRWEQEVYISYSSKNGKTLLKIEFEIGGISLWKLDPPFFGSPDERYYRGFMEHFVNALKTGEIASYRLEEFEQSYSGLKQVVYISVLSFLFIGSVILFSGDFFRETNQRWYIWLSIIVLISLVVIYSNIRFNQKTIEL